MKINKNIFICALLVLMLLLCVNAASATDETLDTNLTSEANDIVSIEVDDSLASDAGSEVLGDGNTLIVGDGGYTSISSAVSAANGGETILIKNGEYSETSAITIKESVNIVGESQDGVKITGPSNSLFKFTTDKAIDVLFDKLTILNTGSGSNPAIIATYSAHNINITNCTFDSCGSKWGTIQFGHPGTGLIDDCKILNSKDTATSGCGAVYVSNSGKYTIKNTIIDNVQYTPTSSYMYSAIYINNDNAAVNIENVSISNVSATARGVIFAKGTLIINGSKIRDNSLTKMGTNSNNVICVAKNAKVTIEQTEIVNNTCADQIFCNIDSTSKITANYNNIQGNSASGIVNSVGTINLEANYWGSNVKPADVSASTWVIEKDGDYVLAPENTTLEKTIPGLSNEGGNEPSPLPAGIIYMAENGNDTRWFI